MKRLVKEGMLLIWRIEFNHYYDLEVLNYFVELMEQLGQVNVGFIDLGTNPEEVVYYNVKDIKCVLNQVEYNYSDALAIKFDTPENYSRVLPITIRVIDEIEICIDCVNEEVIF